MALVRPSRRRDIVNIIDSRKNNDKLHPQLAALIKSLAAAAVDEHVKQRQAQPKLIRVK